MSDKCEFNQGERCGRFGITVTPAICERCKSHIREAADRIDAHRKEIVAGLDAQIKAADETTAKILLETCEACPHSTTQEIEPNEITAWGRAAAWVISGVGNWLRNTNMMGLSCKLCGCSCSKKGKYGRVVEFLSLGRISGRCPDKDENGKSRWDRALENLKTNSNGGLNNG